MVLYRQRLHLPALLATCLTSQIATAQLSVENIEVVQETKGEETYVQFGIARAAGDFAPANSAFWVFAKYAHPDGGWRDARWLLDGNSCVDDGGNDVVISVDGSPPHNGLLLQAISNDATGWSVRIAWDLDASQLKSPVDGIHLRVFAIELIGIPDGPFEIRTAPDATSPLAAANGSKLRIASEDVIAIGDSGDLTYAASDYGGDRSGPIPPAYPKGVGAFYVMRRELTEGEYAGFLSTLDGRAQSARDITRHPMYSRSGGTIQVTDDSVTVGSPDQPAGFVSWADGTAWAAWAGLRPMSELEFEKIVSSPNQFGAEAMYGGRWERVVTLGNPSGRAFRGSEGPGFIDDLGQPYIFANGDWPGPRALGSGFRGGFGEDSLTNSGDRTYASYDATYGNEYEGFRAVRSAPARSGTSDEEISP